jgi:hypothetical protein
MELEGRFGIVTTAQERTISLVHEPAECSPHALTSFLCIILILFETHTCSEYVRTYAVLSLWLETKILYVDTPHIDETTKLYVKLNVKTEVLELRSSCIRCRVVSTLNMKAGRSFEA